MALFWSIALEATLIVLAAAFLARGLLPALSGGLTAERGIYALAGLTLLVWGCLRGFQLARSDAQAMVKGGKAPSLKMAYLEVYLLRLVMALGALALGSWKAY